MIAAHQRLLCNSLTGAKATCKSDMCLPATAALSHRETETANIST